MTRLVAAFAAALLFATGLALSGMMRPVKVQGFLDIFGAWDPTLAAVMGGAAVTYAIFFRLIRRRARPVCEPVFHLPTARKIDRRLVLGSAIFGAGWGLAGYCPGPALASLVMGSVAPVVFVAAMTAGMGLFSLNERWQARRRQRGGSRVAVPREAESHPR